MEQKTTSAMQKCKNVFDVSGGNELMQAYDEWAKDYDADMESLGYDVYSQVSEVLLKYGTLKARIIDMACGTGLMGESLRRNGFEGELHGLDGSREMVNIAKTKGVYAQLFVQFLVPDEPIKAAEDVQYDALVCAGSITKNHLDPRLIKDFLKLLKIGGVMSFAIRETGYNTEMLKQLHPVLKELEDSGRVEKLEDRVFVGGLSVSKDDVPDDFQADDFSDKGATRVYCYKKL